MTGICGTRHFSGCERTNHQRTSVESKARRVLGDVQRFALLRCAQYFFILALTALRCAADIFERLGLGSRVSATPRADVATVRLAALEIDDRPGNTLSN